MTVSHDPVLLYWVSQESFRFYWLKTWRLMSFIFIGLKSWCLMSFIGLKTSFMSSDAYTEKSFRNLVKSTRNQILFTIFRLIWNKTGVHLDPYQSENGKYNLISVWFNKIYWAKNLMSHVNDIIRSRLCLVTSYYSQELLNCQLFWYSNIKITDNLK